MTSTMAVIASATILASALWATPALAQRGDLRIRHQVTGGNHARHQVTGGGHHTRHQVMGGHQPSMPAHPIATPPGPGRPGHPHGGFGHHHHRGFAKHGFGSGPIVLYSPGYAYGYPSYGYGGPVYPDASASYGYDPAPAYSYAPSYSYTPSPSVSVAPMPTVIEHPTGRYELRGDGITSSYRWVWIPNPPSTPPAATPPAPPAPPAAAERATPAPAEPPRRSTLYRWTDREGVVHLTDNISSVPPEHRAKAQLPSL